MSMPMKAVDRLFERLAATYGSAWTKQWADVPMVDVKTAWAHELAPFGERLDCVAWALENLPERCPNVITFRNLCNTKPAPAVAFLPEPKADPARVAAELAKLGTLLVKPATSSYDHKAWADRILSRHKAGESINPTSLRFAREARGVKA